MSILRITLLLFIFLLISPRAVFSAVDIKWNIGIKMGYGFVSALFEDPSVQASPGFFSIGTFSGGVFINVSHNDNIAGLQVEFLYLRKEFRRTNLIGLLHTISVPFLLRINIPYGAYTNLGFAITGITNNGIQTSGEYAIIKDEFDKIEYDLVVAFGWEITAYKQLRVLLEARAFFTINNISYNLPEEIRHYGLHFYTGLVY